jgi:hypothetical protein
MYLVLGNRAGEAVGNLAWVFVSEQLRRVDLFF